LILMINLKNICKKQKLISQVFLLLKRKIIFMRQLMSLLLSSKCNQEENLHSKPCRGLLLYMISLPRL